MSAMALRLCSRLGLAVLGACRSAPNPDSSSRAVDAAAVTEDAWRAGEPLPVAPARCHPEQAAYSIDDGGEPDELSIGDAISNRDGEAVGIVRRMASGRLSGVVLIPREGGAARVVDLGPTLGDAPPPRLASRASDIVAAAYAVPRLGAGPLAAARTARELTLYTISSEAAVAPLLSIEQERDDSLAFDLVWSESHGIAVWDEVTGAARGVIRGTVLSSDRPIGPSRDLSPAESDAESPRVITSDPGFMVFWIARSADPSGSAIDASELETTGEARSRGWLEMIALDEHGVARGAVKRITSASGHVTGYDVQPLSTGAKATLLVVARDDGEVVDGSGGALLRVRVTGDVVEPPVAFATDGLGRGAPSFVGGVGGQPPSLAWVSFGEHLRLLPLDLEGAPTAAPSAELAMDEARPLLWLSAGRILVATPSDEAAGLRAFTCAR